MAHKILPNPPEEKKEKKKFSLRKIFHTSTPQLIGKFGISFFWQKKEIFIGIAIANVEIEKVIRRKKQRILIREGRGRVLDIG
jgi:hypothetical protein